MSLKLVRTGAASTPVRGDLTAPTAVRISGNGLRAFHRSQLTSLSVGASDFEGQINAEDWSGSSWSRAPGIGGSTGGSEIYGEGKNEFQISKNGALVAWDFQYHSPNTFRYTGIQVNSGRYYAFVPANAAAPSYAAGTQITPNQNAIPGGVYVPKKIRFSDDGSRLFIYFQSFNNLIEVNPGSSGSSSLWFPFNGTYGNNLLNFEISGDGNHIFVFIGESLKLFSWSGSDWQFSNEVTTYGSALGNAAVNYDGTIVAIRATAIRVFKKTGSTWAQLGEDLPDGIPWVNSTGTLAKAGGKIYEWTGSTWVYKWHTPGAISDDGTVAVTTAGPGSIVRCELKDVAPIYFANTLAAGIYAGATEGKAIYYGPNLLWNVAGW